MGRVSWIIEMVAYLSKYFTEGKICCEKNLFKPGLIQGSFIEVSIFDLGFKA